MADLPFPRSPFDLTGGMVYFARMLDKIRQHAAGRLRPEYHENFGNSFDGRCCRFLHLEFEGLEARVLQGGSDEEILRWCFEKGRQLSSEDIFVWNKFMTKRGLRDEDDGSTQELEAYKVASGLGHRVELDTFFAFFEVDENRKA